MNKIQMNKPWNENTKQMTLNKCIKTNINTLK
jgi:hypothetical protein